MKNSGKALLAALRLIGLAGAAVLVLLVVAFLAKVIGAFVLDYLAWVLVGLWVLFTAFAFYFFRDPDPLVPTAPNLVVSPGHGKVDAIGTVNEPEFMGGECQRISIFLSVISVHVQYAPVTRPDRSVQTRARPVPQRVEGRIGAIQRKRADRAGGHRTAR